MKTDDLITMLAQDAAPPPGPSVERRAWAGLALGFVGALVLYLLVLGPRPDLLGHMADPLVLAKMGLPLALFALALVLAMRTARPGAGAGRTGWIVWAVPALAVLLFGWSFAVTPPAERWRDFIGHSIPICLPAITVLSLPMTAGLLAAFRRGAPVHLRRTGAMAGLAAAGLSTVIYSTFCTEDSPLFYATWYSLGILASAAIGAWAAGRWLRW